MRSDPEAAGGVDSASGAVKTTDAGGAVSSRQRSLKTPGSALLKENDVVVVSPGNRVPFVFAGEGRAGAEGDRRFDSVS